MSSDIEREDLYYFYEHTNEKNSILIIISLILTMGLYYLYWIYRLNKHLEHIDDKAPNTLRASFILFYIPLFWIPLSFFSTIYFGGEYALAIKFIKILVWAFLSFVLLQYLFDFCKSYSRVTKTPAFLWYIMLYLGYFSLIMFVFDFYYTVPLVIIPILTIVSMQLILNRRHNEHKIKKQGNYFNYLDRK